VTATRIGALAMMMNLQSGNENGNRTNLLQACNNTVESTPDHCQITDHAGDGASQ
jgi:hypothetical protein